MEYASTKPTDDEVSVVSATGTEVTEMVMDDLSGVVQNAPDGSKKRRRFTGKVNNSKETVISTKSEPRDLFGVGETIKSYSHAL